ncbi:MAG: AAA family ATPase, partial [Deltaproteobacteria bacterium]|nr:AAA family ATPase [Deltaproteobacteria bacterium]
MTQLTGQIEIITFTNEENGYTVAKVKTQEKHDLVTIVGNLPAVALGEILEMKGTWKDHARFGEQFDVTSYTIKVPATVYGIKKYLGSGLIKGLGPKTAEKIVNAFGKETLDVIEYHIEKLTKIEGIGKKRVHMIRAAWLEQKEIRDPFRLADDIFGVGFKTADMIAEKLGFPKDSVMRIEAGIIYLLKQFADDGHVYYPYEGLSEKGREVLEVKEDIVRQAIDTLAKDKKIIIEDTDSNASTASPGKRAYLKGLYQNEAVVAERLKALTGKPKSIRDVNVQKAIEWVQERLLINLADQQVEAIRCVLENKVTLITGGPGTGKTTIVGGLLKILSSLKIRILLAAPTGRAAKQLSEATGHDAQTIHRMLEFSMHKGGGFQKNEENPLDCDLLVVDEASMIDIALMSSLLKAMPDETTFVLVGDVHQLPSVGPGTVLKDMISSGAFSVIKLDKIFRQAKESQIIVNAHQINNGVIPSFETELPSSSRNDFYFRERNEPEDVLAFILDLVNAHLPKQGFDSLKDIQVLTPMNKGILGVENLNKELQKQLNPGEDVVIRGSKNFRINDKVMQIRNNYDKGVFNGDIGRIGRIRLIDQEVDIVFDDRAVKYDYSDLDEIVLAYAISVHKSQGSEYPA